MAEWKEIIKDRVYAKKIAWRDVSDPLKQGTFCWNDDNTHFEQAMSFSLWQAHAVIAHELTDCIFQATRNAELPDPFIIRFKDRTWKEISAVAYLFELFAVQIDMRYCVDWWFGEPGSNPGVCLIAIRHTGLAELALAPSADVLTGVV